MRSLKDVLEGIDQDSTECASGYWETSAGVEFGKGVLREALEIEQILLERINELEAEVAKIRGVNI